MCGGKEYQLAHLNQCDKPYPHPLAPGKNLVIRTIFGLHCFTEKKLPTHEPDLNYTLHHTDPRCFSILRHELSLNLPSVINGIIGGGGKVQRTTSDSHYVRITVQTIGERQYDYAVFFSLDRAQGVRDVDLMMRIRSAHERDEDVRTFGDVRFKNLVELTLKGKKPKKVFR
jgi:hypothetical protein